MHGSHRYAPLYTLTTTSTTTDICTSYQTSGSASTQAKDPKHNMMHSNLAKQAKANMYDVGARHQRRMRIHVRH